MNRKILILHDIRSAQNVGSLFRTSDAVGIEKIYLSKITPSPIDRFGRENTSLTKASLGAEKNIDWQVYEDINDLIHQLVAGGVQVIAIEQSDTSKDYKDVDIKMPVAFILGNEVSGIPEDVLRIVDTVVQIPMHGQKESLNVAVAGGVVLFRMLNI